MKTITSLIISANQSAMARGHMLTWFVESDQALGMCGACGMEVQCLTRPAPNQINISGTAVAQNCRKEV